MSAADLALAFGIFTALLSALLVGLLWRLLPAKAAAIGGAGLLLWLGYVGLLGGLGVLRDPSLRPPGIVFLALPAFAGVALVALTGPSARILTAAVPAWLLIGLQTFRVGVEFALHRLHELGLVAHAMTLAGGNVEILVALAAPLAAWLSSRGNAGRRIATGWNLLGLASLLNVAVRGVLGAPGPQHLAGLEPPNVAIGILPFSYIPGLMVPLALTLHLLAWRRLRTTLAASAGVSATFPTQR